MSASERTRTEQVLNGQGGPDAYLAQCREALSPGIVSLRVADLLAALQAGGIQVTEQTLASPTTPLVVYSGPEGKTPAVSYSTDELQGERYLQSLLIIPFLKAVTALPLHLKGLTNPVLSVGPVKLQLGTAAAPVQAVDLLAFALSSERLYDGSGPLPLNLRVATVVATVEETNDPRLPQLMLGGQEGQLYAVLQNTGRLRGGDTDLLSVHHLTQGKLTLNANPLRIPFVVSSINDLDTAAAQGKAALLVYALDASDLRQLKLTVLNPAQVKIVQP